MEAIRALRWGIALVLAASAIGCSSGSTTPSCNSDKETVCGSSCFNLQESAEHCGTCDNKCSDGKSCKAGKCESKTTSNTGGGSSVGGSSNKGGASSSNGGSSSSNGGSSNSNTTSTSSNGGSSSSNGGSGTATSNGGTSSSNGGSSSGTPKGGATGTAKGGSTSTSAGGASTGGTNNTSKGGTSTANGGSSVTPGGAPTGGVAAGGAPPTAGTSSSTPTGPCAASESLGLVSDFEEGQASAPPVVKDKDGRKGAWERFAGNVKSDGSGAPNFKMTVESSGSGQDCNKWALHVSGTNSDWGDWVGVGLNLAGTPVTNPDIYDASKYTGIRFKAKKGSGHDSKSPVRFNIAIPETEGKDSPGDHDACVAKDEDATKAARDCYQHMGRFLHVASGYDADYELGSEWKTYNLCFDRDLYPLSLPSILTEEERSALPKRILKLQWQFNNGKDWYVSSYPSEGKYSTLSVSLPFDIWIDDVEFFNGECPNSSTFKSTDGAKKPFPQNAGVSTACAPPEAAKNFAHAVSRAYAMWTKNFVRDNKVIAPEQENGVTTSESMGYGMLISAAMGDKTAFDKFYGYVKTQLNGNSLMTWKTGGSGSATDGDVDIAFALLMADAQWGGDYKDKATPIIAGIKGKDVNGDKVLPGDGWSDAFNPSYFAPSYFKTFGGMDTVISGSYTRLKTNTGSNFPTDWTDWSGGAINPPGQVTAGFNKPAYGYDAARVPWRVGLGGCAGDADGKAIAKTIVDFFASKYDSGATIDLMKAGWIKSSGAPAATGDGSGAPARDFQGSFIGPLGVGAMASGNTVVRDRALRTILDIMENGDFNHTYFPSTVGLITLLIMTGNFPTP